MRRLEINNHEKHGYSVVVDGLFADELTVDEALGVVASALFSQGKPMYVRTYDEWAARRKAWGQDTEDGERGMLPAPAPGLGPALHDG